MKTKKSKVKFGKIIFLLLLMAAFLIGIAYIKTTNQHKQVTQSQAIYGGIGTQQRYWPFMVRLYYKDYLNKTAVTIGNKTKYKHNMINASFCGGTLIDSNWVLTAAHCAKQAQSKEYLGVAIGINNLKKDLIDEENVITRSVSEIYENSYSSSTNENDIALLKLDQPVPVKFKTISLSDSVPLEYVEKTPVGMMGWGEVVGNPKPENLSLGVAPIVSNNRANKTSWDHGLVTQNMIAAGYPSGGTSFCFGDSGGPMILWDGTRFIQVGMTNWSSKERTNQCGGARDPTVGPRLSSYFNWIQSTIKQNDGGKILLKNSGTFYAGKRTLTIPSNYYKRVDAEFKNDDKTN